ncbi:MAG: hypothetical protein RL737_395 [Bacteroidota bacterium]|jgi:hypothetical protein
MPTLKSYTFASPASQPTSQSLQKSMPFPTHRHSNTTDRQTTKDRRAAGNSGFAKWRVQCFYDSLVQGSTFGILMNICAKNPPLRKAAKPLAVMLKKTY